MASWLTNPDCISGFLIRTASHTTPPIDPLHIKNFVLQNRLLVDTGKYTVYDTMQKALDASGCDVVTVAVRCERLIDAQGKSLFDLPDLSRGTILPNAAGGFTVAELSADVYAAGTTTIV